MGIMNCVAVGYKIEKSRKEKETSSVDFSKEDLNSKEEIGK
jgi:hypothetical protein